MAALICPRDGGRLLPITGAPSNPRPGKPSGAPITTGYRCTKGHTLSIAEATPSAEAAEG